jgi:hypothetical protein
MLAAQKWSIAEGTRIELLHDTFVGFSYENIVVALLSHLAVKFSQRFYSHDTSELGCSFINNVSVIL